MDNNMMTINEVADILGLHHKTVRGFISTGRLNAVKVGKQWRIAKADLDRFMGKKSSLDNQTRVVTDEINVENGEFVFEHKNEHSTNINKKIQISAVADVHEVNKSKYERISNTLLAVMNSRDDRMKHATIHIKYDESLKICKIFLWGSTEYVQEMLSCISLLENENTDENKY